MERFTSLKTASATQRTQLELKGAKRCRRKFLRHFPGGFHDETYIAWERDYKWEAHKQWQNLLAPEKFRSLLKADRFSEIANHAVRIELRTNLLFSFEKMALRDAVKIDDGATLFAEGLFEFLHGQGGAHTRFANWCETIAALPRKQTRVLTWPIVTVFGFIAQPRSHIFLKPNVTKRAADMYGFDFHYETRPSWSTYQSLLDFGATVRRDVADLRPRDMIDIQSFIWVQGSDEYD